MYIVCFCFNTDNLDKNNDRFMSIYKKCVAGSIQMNVNIYITKNSVGLPEVTSSYNLANWSPSLYNA